LVTLNQEVYLRLKHHKTGEEALQNLRTRMWVQVKNPNGDPMTEKTWYWFQKYKDQLRGRILDVGCYTGCLYHWLGKPDGYTGIDNWPEAIQVAKEFAPGVDFRVADLNSFETEPYDVVWSSQLILNPQEIEKIKSFGKKAIVIVRHENRMELADAS
jgi:SAM-dependent methyltransferase